MKEKKPANITKQLLKEIVEIRHSFTAEEYRTKTEVLTRNMQLVDEKEAQVKAEAAHAKAEIKGLKAAVTELANKLSSGYEMVKADASVELNRRKGAKRFYLHCPGKPQHGDFVKEAPMTEEDYANLVAEETPETPAVNAETPVDNSQEEPVV